MASETIDADRPRGRHNWSENSKVYTRKFRKKDLSSKSNGENVTVCAATNSLTPVENRTNTADITVTAPSAIISNNENEKQNNKENDFVFQPPETLASEEAISSQQKQTPPASNESLNQNGTNDKESDVVPQLPSQTLALEEANSSEPQVILVGFNESSNQNKQTEVTPPNGCVRANENGAVKPILMKVGDRMRISLKTERPKSEIRELKRKLVNELHQVRSVVKRLEDEAFLLSGHSTASVVGGYGHPRYSMNDGRALTRVFSDVGSVAPYESRPFRPLSVSIVENRGIGELSEKEKRTPKANQYYQNSEFLLGKDRLPPEGGNKRWKPHGGRKHGRQGGHRFGAERYISKAFKGCSNLLTRLMKHKHGWVFNKPVDVEALNLHDYHVIIKQPMDLGTIKTRLSKNLYKSPLEFAEDVKLTFHNAMTYNPKGHEVHAMAEELLKIFESKWLAIESDYNLALRYEMVQDMGLPTPTSRPPVSHLRDLERPESTGLVLCYPKDKFNTGSGKTPVPKKPKAKDPHKRDMTYEEKQRLSSNLQSLPSEKLDDIVQIIKKRNSDVSQHDDEIEVDIDSVDVETLWELDRFVSNFKKNLSKKKRRAELALQARAEAAPPNPTASVTPATAKSQEESKIGEKSDATPDRGEGERDGIGQSSSSSSSSSDSGSSSDTDTNSSSSNGSDGGGSPRT